MSTEITRTSLHFAPLEYCAAVWDPYLTKDINTLENIQRRAARFIIQDHSRFTSVSSLLKDLNWAPLKDRRRDIRLAMLFKIVKYSMQWRLTPQVKWENMTSQFFPPLPSPPLPCPPFPAPRPFPSPPLRSRPLKSS